MKKVVSLLLATAMLLTLAACGKKGGGSSDPIANSPKAVAMAYVQAQIMADSETLFPLFAYDYEAAEHARLAKTFGSEENIFAAVSRQEGADIQSWNDYYRLARERAEQRLKDRYGDNYSLTVRAIEQKEMEAATVSEHTARLMNYVFTKDFVDTTKLAEVKEGFIVTVELKVKGKADESERTYDIPVVKYDGQWKVVRDIDVSLQTLPLHDESVAVTTAPNHDIDER